MLMMVTICISQFQQGPCPPKPTQRHGVYKKKSSNAAGYIKKEGKLYLSDHQQVRLTTQECQVPQGTLWVWLILDPRDLNVIKCLTSARGMGEWALLKLTDA